MNTIKNKINLCDFAMFANKIFRLTMINRKKHFVRSKKCEEKRMNFDKL